MTRSRVSQGSEKGTSLPAAGGARSCRAEVRCVDVRPLPTKTAARSAVEHVTCPHTSCPRRVLDENPSSTKPPPKAHVHHDHLAKRGNTSSGKHAWEQHSSCGLCTDHGQDLLTCFLKLESASLASICSDERLTCTLIIAPEMHISCKCCLFVPTGANRCAFGVCELVTKAAV